nr:MAG TPA: hypothetical protein [Caudoviricetes sp.]
MVQWNVAENDLDEGGVTLRSIGLCCIDYV